MGTNTVHRMMARLWDHQYAAGIENGELGRCETERGQAKGGGKAGMREASRAESSMAESEKRLCGG